MSDFSRDIFVWLAQVARDNGLPAAAPRLAITLSNYINRATGDAWPSVPRLAGDLGVSENTVRSATKALVERGHLDMEAGGGRRATN
jgi:DNA-binding FadR family transcriptional regulator